MPSLCLRDGEIHLADKGSHRLPPRAGRARKPAVLSPVGVPRLGAAPPAGGEALHA